MKKLAYLFMAMFAVMSLASCDEDLDQAMTLSGQWYGDFGMYYGIQDRYGRYYEFDADYTDLVFYPDYDYATSGYGKQVDYYSYGPYSRQYYYFYWQIDRGVLYLTYPYDPELNVDIYRYRMSGSYFSGNFGNSNSSFRLRKLYDYYDWGYYSGYYSYYPSSSYGSYYYSPRYAPSADGNKPAMGQDENLVVKRGNRYLDAKAEKVDSLSENFQAE